MVTAIRKRLQGFGGLKPPTKDYAVQDNDNLIEPDDEVDPTAAAAAAAAAGPGSSSVNPAASASATADANGERKHDLLFDNSEVERRSLVTPTPAHAVGER